MGWAKIISMNPQTMSAIQVASRVHGFSYAIRNIVAEALKVGESAGPLVAVVVVVINFARLELMLVFTRATAR